MSQTFPARQGPVSAVITGPLQAGDVLTITAYSVNASDVSASIIWVEDI